MKILYIFIVLLMFPNIALGQLVGADTLVGDSCATYPQGATQMVADADLNQQDVILICDGAIWQTMTSAVAAEIDRIEDNDIDTFVDVDSSDDDVIRFSSTGREMLNILASGTGDFDTTFNLITDAATSNTGLFFSEAGVDTAYVGLGYGSSSLNLDTIATGQDIIFRTQGTSRMVVDDTGNLGINASSPLFPLDVNGDVRVSRIVNYLDNAAYIDFSTQDVISFVVDGGTSYLTLDGVNNRIDIGVSGTTSSPDNIIIGNNNSFYVDKTTDRVGIGTNTPRVKLDVNGALRVGPSTDLCTASLEGGLRWNTTDLCIEVCDGTAWDCSLEAECSDDFPNTLSFFNQTDVATSTVIESDIRLVNGISGCTVQVSVQGDGIPEYRICSDVTCTVVDVTWSSALGNIEDGKYLQLRSTSGASGSITNNISFMVGRRSETWTISTQGNCADANPPLGTICADDTVYIGRTSDGFAKMYSQRCRNPRVWNGTNCVGTAITRPWNNNTTAPFYNAVGAANSITGQANTTDLVNADINTDNFAPYGAANYCNDLGDSAEPEAHGHTDWYLPSLYEANRMCDVLGPNGAAIDWNSIWTSNERDDDEAFYERNDCFTGLRRVKWTGYNVMCVRKENTNGLDTVPEAFAFVDVTGAALSTLITSSAIDIFGTDGGSPASITGDGSPEMALNTRPWATTGTVVPRVYNPSVQVRLTSAATGNTTNSATVNIGGVTTIWNVTTGDSSPDAFSFTDQTGVNLSTLTSSNIISITGIGIPAPVSVSGTGSPLISINGGGFVASGTINNGDTLQVQLTSSAASSTTNTATIDVGGVTSNWNVTTGDSVPDAFSFTDQINVALSTLTSSNTISITGINIPTPVSVSGDGSPLISINGGGFVASGTINNGDTLQVQLTSSATNSTQFDAIVDVGGVLDTWSVTTQP